MRDPLAELSTEPDAETAALIEQVDALLAEMPPVPEMTVEQLRAESSRSASDTRMDEGVDRAIDGPGGDILLRVFVPEAVNGVYLNLHGGGWMGDSAAGRDPQLWEIACRAGVAVVSVGYRLAPEHPYPSGPDDCEAAALWLIEHAATEFGTDRLTIGGDSAGAHLTVVTLLRLRDKHGYSGFRGAEMRFGCYDLRLTPSVRRGTWSRLGPDAISHLRDMFVKPEAWEDPDVSPIFAELHDMPPALFTCGTHETLLDDTLFMWARWRASRNDAELRIYPGGTHAFDVLPLDISRRAMAEIHGFLAACVREG